jgi:hypothetical protein
LGYYKNPGCVCQEQKRGQERIVQKKDFINQSGYAMMLSKEGKHLAEAAWHKKDRRQP